MPFKKVLLIFCILFVTFALAFFVRRPLVSPDQKSQAQENTDHVAEYLPETHTPKALDEMLQSIDKDKYVIVDVRNKKEYDRGHIPGAVHANYYDPEDLKAVAGNKIPITYCTYSAWRGPYAAYELYKQGYKDVRVLTGGITAWNEQIKSLSTNTTEDPYVYPHPEQVLMFPEHIADADVKDLGTVNIKMKATQFAFSPSQIIVKKGQKVLLDITSADVIHGFALPEYGIVEELLPNKTKRIEFVADKKGSFPFVCSVYCGQDTTTGHSHASMVGEFIVQ